MPADTQVLAAAMADGGDDIKMRKGIMKEDPEWEKYEATKNFQDALRKLGVEKLRQRIPESETRPNSREEMTCFPAAQIKEAFSNDPDIIQALMQVFTIPASANHGVSMLASKAFDWTLTLLYDALREDSSIFTDFELAFKNNATAASLVTFVGTAEAKEEYTAGKAAWLLTSLIANIPDRFSDEDVKQTLDALVSENGFLTTQARLEALSNLLKCNSLRKQVWQKQGVSGLILSVQPQDPSQVVYRFVFNIWMLSFEPDIALKGSSSLKSCGVVGKLKAILATNRTEKVVRLSLTVLRNFLKHKDLCGELVEAEILDVVQQLEYEKWRDTELYESIREVAQLVATEQSEFSNFDHYLRELRKGKLSWGFIHTYKFWAENYKFFDQSNYAAIKELAGLLTASGDETTLAVACHDLGEFVSLHPSGKTIVGQLGVKENVMRLMSKEGEPYRQVRREALLCCQKIMLNKWQDAAAGKTA